VYVGLFFLCLGLSFVATGLAMGLSPVLGLLPKSVNSFVISEVKSESVEVQQHTK